jgi:thymidylate synthase ThyX
MTINARALEHAIRKMLSHPLAEVRAMGTEIKQVALAEVPTLVKYAEAVPYLEETARVLAAEASHVIDTRPAEWCHLISCDEEGEIRVLAAALYRYGSFSYPAALEYTRGLSTEKRALLAKTLLTGRERYDIPLRELEHAVYSFDLVLDQGAYFELKRHRMMTQTTPAFTPSLGNSIPRRISAAGMEDIYRQAMESARETYDLLAQWNPTVASDVLPNAYNRRVLITSNLRSLAHLINLRTAPTAHFSLRRIVHRIAEKVVEVTPLLGVYLRPNVSETWQSIEANYFTQV